MKNKTETELIQEAVTQANDKLKERLEKGEIGITLENGTTLTIGSKYRLNGWNKNEFCKVEFFGDRLFIAKSHNDCEEAWRINDNWLPYEPKEEPKPFVAYKKYFADNNNGMLFIQYWATRPHNTAKMKWYDESEARNLGLKI